MESPKIDTAFNNPFNDEISKYAIRFAQPVFFGNSPAITYEPKLANGTVSLLKLGDLYVGVTCQHVMAGYYERMKDTKDLIFQIGRVQLDPLEYLISEDKKKDLATINLTHFVDNRQQFNDNEFINPVSWPPECVAEDDLLCLAGFPGIWREQLGLGTLRFYSFSSGTCKVYSVNEEHFVTRIEAEECVMAINKGIILGSLGGMSGGPAFAWRRGAILRAELVGFIYEYQENLDLMYIRSAKVINQDGTIS